LLLPVGGLRAPPLSFDRDDVGLRAHAFGRLMPRPRSTASINTPRAGSFHSAGVLGLAAAPDRAEDSNPSSMSRRYFHDSNILTQCSRKKVEVRSLRTAADIPSRPYVAAGIPRP
jgi:hypothetical protein